MDGLVQGSTLRYWTPACLTRLYANDSTAEVLTDSSKVHNTRLPPPDEHLDTPSSARHTTDGTNSEEYILNASYPVGNTKRIL
jgi:hypothetical protein